MVALMSRDLNSKEFLFIVVIGDNGASIRENDLCGEQIVERQPEPADQRPIAAAQRQSSHADGANCACHGRKAERICGSGNV